jgi:hypothetical protein
MGILTIIIIILIAVLIVLQFVGIAVQQRIINLLFLVLFAIILYGSKV